MRKRYDHVVVGSGMGGLATAITLAKEGHSVCVLEKNNQFGGNLQTFVRSRTIFDTGVHYLGGLAPGHNLHRYFKYLGIMDQLEVRQLAMDGFDVFSFDGDDRRYRHAQGIERFAAVLKEQFPKEEQAIDAYCSKLREFCAKFPMYELKPGAPYTDESGLLTLGAREYIDSLTEDKVLRAVLGGSNLLYAGDHDRSPFYVHALSVYSYIQSAYRVVRGGSQITKLLVRELRKHGEEPGFKNIDLGRIVLAGYDIGAYTAMVAAGEKLPNSKAPPLGEAVAGVIALSPFADFSGVPFETRYAGITAPVLSITGRGDVDNYGWVPSEALRQAPFKHMPPGSKALLLLEDCSHELLGGNPLVSQVVETSIKRENPDADTPRRGDRGEGPGRRRTSVPGMAVEQSAPTGPWAFARSAVSAVTTAYLDAEIKKDSFAKEWLGRDSRRWLRETATLTVK